MKTVDFITAERISDYLVSVEPDMIAFLEKLVKIETPSDSRESQDLLFGLIEEKLNSVGYRCVRLPGKITGGALFARPAKRTQNSPLQLLIGHCDTVWPVDSISQMPVEINNGMMSGPGIFDMKAGLTQILFALESIYMSNSQIEVTPVVLINSDEEIGSFESTNHIRRLAKIANRAFVLEPPLGIDGKLKTARKGGGQFEIVIKGRAAHAGLDPDKGASAIVEMSYVIQKLFALNDPEKGISVNVGTIEGGVTPNMIAAESKAIIDVRFLHKEDASVITDAIKKIQPQNPEIEILIDGGINKLPLERTLRNQRLYQLAVKSAALIDLEIDHAVAGGGSDGNTTSLYTATLDGLGTTGDGAHALHEFIMHEKLLERTHLLAYLLLAPKI